MKSFCDWHFAYLFTLAVWWRFLQHFFMMFCFVFRLCVWYALNINDYWVHRCENVNFIPLKIFIPTSRRWQLDEASRKVTFIKGAVWKSAVVIYIELFYQDGLFNAILRRLSKEVDKNFKWKSFCLVIKAN